MSMIAKNIAHLRKLKERSQEQFAADLGITKARLGSYEEARSSPPIELLIQLSDHFNLPIDVLVRRDITRSNSESFIEVGNHRVLFPITVDKFGGDEIEVVGVKASAGYLNGYADPEYIGELPRMKLPFMPTGKFRAFPIRGDSMPPLQEGAFVVGKFLEDINWVRDGKTYIVVTSSEGIVYKRVYKKEEEPVLQLHSDNRSYDPYQVHYNEVLEMWEFTCSINTQDYEDNDLNHASILKMFRELQVELKELKAS